MIGSALFVALLPWYLRAIFAGGAEPHPLSWGIWAAISVAGMLSTTAGGGAGPMAIVLAVASLVQCVIFAMALVRAPLALTARDLWPAVPAAIGVVAWLIARAPLLATVGVVVADLCGLGPTLTKTWWSPYSEPPVIWAVGTVALLLGCLSVTRPSVATLLYPVSVMAGSAAVAAVAQLRRSFVTSMEETARLAAGG